MTGGFGAILVPSPLRRLRRIMAVAAAPPAARIAVPTSSCGQRRDRCFGGSRRRAVAESMAPTFGATVSWTETLPRAARTAIHARARPTLGPAQPAAPPAPRTAPRLADTAAFAVIGPA